MSDADPWRWWKAALNGVSLPNGDADPQQGYYERRTKSQKHGTVTRSVVAFWRNGNGVLLCKVDARDPLRLDISGEDQNRILESWVFLRARPITQSTYEAVRKTGLWPDEHEAAHLDRLADIAANGAAVPIAEMEKRINALAGAAVDLIAKGVPTDDLAAARAADLSDRLAWLGKKTSSRPLAELAETNAKAIKLAILTPYLNNQKARRDVSSTGPVKIASGRMMKAIGLREGKPVVEIVDYQAALAHFGEAADVRSAIHALATAAAREGNTPPGCRIVTNDKAA